MTTDTTVILFTRGTMGDIYPFLHVGRKLKQMGCKVTLMSNYRYHEQAEQEAFGFVALDNEEWFDYLSGMPESSRKLPSLLELYRNLTPITLAKELALVEGLIGEGNTVILAHSNDYMVPLMAREKYGVTLYLCVLAPSFVYSLLFFEGVLKSLSKEINEARDKIGMTPVEDWSRWMKGFSKTFAFWPNWFEDGQENEILKMENVGFPSVGVVERRCLQHEVIRFLECRGKTIVITHGTSRPFRDNYFKLAIEACQGTGHNLIIVTPFKEYLPKDVETLDGIMVVDYCPFHELLLRVDLVVHHGGIGTLREAIACGTPQLIIGKGYDRPHNGRIVKNLNVGDWISPNALSVPLLKQTMERLLNARDLSESCNRYMELLVDHQICDSFYGQVVRG